MLSKVKAIARKELSIYFASPVAYIFIGTFLLVSMFIFFWVESFFSRNITDVRPLFDWMPILLVFLVSALTMRMWSEERRMGTVEFLMTMPVHTMQLVLGKFFACLALVLVALLLTLPIPLSVAFMGSLDWGPVVGAYLAAILLAGAYVAVGLFISARTESQIVSLMLSIIVCFVMYLIGSSTFTALFGNFWGEVLRLVGTGSRFESIKRGIIDLRDLYYYISVIGTFIALNILTLERLKWSEVKVKPRHTFLNWMTGLAILNLLVANFWLQKANFIRVDLTEGQQYTISEATRTVLSQLQEPLLIRGYFSSKTHPLLAPLVPQVRDMLSEYSIYGGDMVRSEFIDPREYPELEEEASQKYNIKPVPFQVADRYQAALVNSYFNVLISYGDKYEVLGFRELIEVKVRNEAGLDVQLRNLEYDLTRAIKKVMSGFKTTDSFFAALKAPVKLTAYVSERTQLPPKLSEYLSGVEKVAQDLKQSAGGNFEVEYIDPQAGDGQIAKEIYEKYGFQPMVASLLDPKQFYFYLTLEHNQEAIQLALPDNFNVEGAKQTIEAGLKRFSPGFLKTIGLSTPPVQSNNPFMMQQGMSPEGRRFNILRQKLEENHTIKQVDLSNGVVSDDIDLLMVMAPEGLADKDQFAVDQFLMRGGTVVLATSPLGVTRSAESLTAKQHTSGLEGWLKQHGLTIDNKLVLDKNNEPYPVPVTRSLGAFNVQELRMVNYPPFVDIRERGLAKHGITSGVQQVTLNWSSPIIVAKSEKYQLQTLLKSSKNSWIAEDNSVDPDFRTYPELGFPVTEQLGEQTLAVLLEGEFESYFKGKQSPLLAETKKQADSESETEPKSADVFASVIEKSPNSARLIVFASNEFLTDQVLEISASSGTERYLNTLQLAENTVDWALEDAALLTIRNRGQFSRTLLPLSEQAKMTWEYANYIFALLSLLVMYWLAHSYRSSLKRRYAQYT